MKRFIVTLFTLCLCLVLSAQIQTKFWGLELSKRYPSLKHAKEIISNKCEHALIESAEIRTQGGRFGGYYWAFGTFVFHDCCLARVNFGSVHPETEAAEKYSALYETLKKKYGSSKVSSSDDGSIHNLWVGDEDPNRCALSLIKGEDANHWVLLSYSSRELTYLMEQVSENEL